MLDVNISFILNYIVEWWKYALVFCFGAVSVALFWILYTDIRNWRKYAIMFCLGATSLALLWIWRGEGLLVLTKDVYIASLQNKNEEFRNKNRNCQESDK